MDCRHCRSTVSARLDGEAAEAPTTAVEAHLRSCAGCRRFAAVATELQARTATAAETDGHVSRSAELLGAMAVVRQRQGRRIDAVRAGLVVVAGLLLGLALPALLLGDGTGASTHLARHLGAWDVALAIGFLVAAAQPVRVIGLFPLAVALAGSMAVAGVLDVAGGGRPMVGELTHALELGGLLLLWALSRHTPRPVRAGIAGRLAA